MKKLIAVMMLCFVMVAGVYAEVKKPKGEFDVQFEEFGTLHYIAFDSLGDCLEYLYLGLSDIDLHLVLTQVANNNTELDSRVITQTNALKATACAALSDDDIVINFYESASKTWTTLIFVPWSG
ncbi:MAG: hypothetical protein Ta2A_18980 [Treponemataceae bacterium]|nr:MAG: hypothetical protein Ta2A_18980 [Treponemataceae bacterium]